MVHIYQLHIVQDPNIGQIKRVSICMHALEKVSEVWLVAAAVQGLFESVLTSSGYDKNIEENTDYTFWNRLEDTNAADHRKDGPTSHANQAAWPSNNPKETPIKAMALTPALREWAAVTLQLTAPSPSVQDEPALQQACYDTGSNSSVDPHDSPIQWEQFPNTTVLEDSHDLEMQQGIIGYGFVLDANSFSNQNVASWSPQIAQGTPPLMGCNPTEW